MGRAAARGALGVDDLGALAALALSGAQERGEALSYAGLKRSLRDAVARDPLDALAVTVLTGAFLLHLAEKDDNPKLATFWDALIYVSTSLSVGYADIFPRTDAGKAIASALMAIGPSMAARALEAPAAEAQAEAREAARVQAHMVETLDAILAELRAARGR